MLHAAHVRSFTRAIMPPVHWSVHSSVGVQADKQFLQPVRIHEYDIVLRGTRTRSRVENKRFTVHIPV